MKQLEVTILGQSYMLSCPDGGEALLRAAVARVDEEMGAIRDAGKVKARERMAVLAALNLAYQLAEQGRSEARPIQGSAEHGHEAMARLMTRLDKALEDDGLLL